MQQRIINSIRKFRQCTSGATLVYFALLTPIVAGFAGLGFDATMWYMEKRQLQSVVDSSAISAAYSLSKGETDAEILLAAIQDAGLNDFTVGGYNTISVVSPPVIGAFAGLSNYVMVTTRRPANQIFTNILGVTDGTIETRATAAILTSGDHCILALDPSIDRALEFSGTSNVDINCGVASNSNSSEAIYLNGTASLSANPSAQAYGDIFQGTNATLDTPNPIQPFSQRSPDPYGPEGRALEVPLFPTTCLETNRFVRGSEGAVTLYPGRYCDGLRFGAGADVTFEPGVYIIDEGLFDVSSGAVINGIGVTIILTATLPEDIATIRVNGGATVNLTAPTTDPYMGVVLYQDQRANYDDGINRINGGADMNLQGAVYFPSQEVTYSGGSSTSSGCLQLIGKKVTFSGNSVLHNDYLDCDLLGIEKVERTLVTLEE